MAGARPRAIARSTSTSRSVSWCNRGGTPSVCGGRETYASTSRRVTVGANSSSPEWQALIAAARSAGGGGLEQETAGTGAQGGEDVHVQVEHREHQHPAPRSRVDDPAGSLQTINPRHLYVHEHDVGTLGFGGGGGGRPVAGLGDHLDVVLDVQDGAQAATDVRSLSSLAELADVPAGSIVRLTLEFTGEGVASCVLGDRCEARRLGNGIGPWDHLATDPEGAGVVVRATYPPTLAPMHVVGRQMADPGAVDRYLTRPWVQWMLGWAEVRSGGIIQHDLSLPVDRLWLGPILFVGLAWALGYGRRVGYPVFRAQGMRGWSWGGSNLGPRDIRATASGRLAPPDRSPLELDGVRMLIRPAAAGPNIEIPAPDGAIVAPIPRELSTWSLLEVGELRFIRSRQPAIRASWYGSQLQLVFDSEADRDTAAVMMRADGGR